MKIIREADSAKLPSERASRFFIQLWYGMVHRNSLDSHRVRCMNPLNILRELQDILSKTFPKIEDDIRRVSQEAAQILGQDKVIGKHFQQSWQRLRPLLAKMDEKEWQKHASLLRYFLRDFIRELSLSYKESILAELRTAIFNTKNEEEIFHYTGILLSMLIDEGHSIEGLFSIVRFIFISNKNSSVFDNNFAFLIKTVNRERSGYEIIFRLEGFRKNELIPSEITGIRFEKEVVMEHPNDRIRSLLSPGQNVLFSRIQVESQDDRSAGLVAKEKLEAILDLIRFELEQEIVSIDQEFVSVRTGKNTGKVFRLPGHIPNPQRNFDKDSFNSFIQVIDNVLKNDNITRESKERLRSAFRFYRMGRDSQEFENKFLNWWTGLEYLVRTGETGSIISEVEKRFLPTMVLSYTSKHLESYRNTLTYCKVRPPKEIIDRYKITEFNELDLAEFFSLIHDPAIYGKIDNQLTAFPSVQYHLNKFAGQTKNAAEVLKFLNRDEQNLKWHINRLYRIRCDIVHSAEYSLNLTLLCANLEFYLKALLSIVFDQLNRNLLVASLNEIYERMNHAYSLLVGSLKAGNLDFHCSILKGETI